MLFIMKTSSTGLLALELAVIKHKILCFTYLYLLIRARL